MLDETLAELCRGAEDIEPMLHSFKNAQQLRVGVRDILGKEDIEATTGALSDIAQACLKQITHDEYERLAAKLGEPTIGEPDADEPGRPCEFVIVAMGKFGGRELNYYSDLDLIFLYEADGVTVQSPPHAPRRLDHQSALLQRAGPADHQGRQPTGALRTVVRNRSAAAAHRAQRHAGHVAGGVRALLRTRARGNCGSGRRCARRGWCTARTAIAEMVARAVREAAFVAALEARDRRRPFGRCAGGWTRSLRQAI